MRADGGDVQRKVELLLEAGADATRTGAFGTMLDLATRYRCREVVRMLQAATRGRSAEEPPSSRSERADT